MSDARRAERRGFALGFLGPLLLALGDQGLYFAAVSGAAFEGHLSDIVAAAPPGRVVPAPLGSLAGGSAANIAFMVFFAALFAASRTPRA